MKRMLVRMEGGPTNRHCAPSRHRTRLRCCSSLRTWDLSVSTARSTSLISSLRCGNARGGGGEAAGHGGGKLAVEGGGGAAVAMAAAGGNGRRRQRFGWLKSDP